VWDCVRGRRVTPWDSGELRMRLGGRVEGWSAGGPVTMSPSGSLEDIFCNAQMLIRSFWVWVW